VENAEDDKGNEEGGEEGSAEEKDEKDEKSEKGKKTKDKEKSNIEKGTIVRFSGVGADEPIKKEEIKKIFEENGQVKFVDFLTGSKEGYVRFVKAEFAAQAISTFTSSPPLIAGSPISVSLLEGEEEQHYWDEKVLKSSGQRGGRGRGGKRGGRGGGRGGRGRGRGKKRKF